MNILLIGGCGYIGSALYDKLKKSYNVTSVDLEWFGNPGVDNYQFDYKTLSRELSEFKTIVLMAGHSSAKMCETDSLSTLNNNVVNFVGLLSKLDKSHKLIYASSSSVYGNASGEVDELNTECSPVNYYDWSKKQIDIYAQMSNVEYYGLRFGTVCGVSPNLRVDTWFIRR